MAYLAVCPQFSQIVLLKHLMLAEDDHQFKLIEGQQLLINKNRHLLIQHKFVLLKPE